MCPYSKLSFKAPNQTGAQHEASACSGPSVVSCFDLGDWAGAAGFLCKVVGSGTSNKLAVLHWSRSTPVYRI